MRGFIAAEFGSLVETMTKSVIHLLFEDHELEILRVSSNFALQDCENNKQKVIEYDEILWGSDFVIINEVKKNLTHSDVDKFVEKVKKFPNFFENELKDYKIYGAISCMSEHCLTSDKVATQNLKKRYVTEKIHDRYKTKPGYSDHTPASPLVYSAKHHGLYAISILGNAPRFLANTNPKKFQP